MFLRGFSGVFGEENVLVNVSQNHRYYSGDLNSSSRIREQEEALFPALAGARLSFLSLSLFPAAWEGLIRHTSIWGEVTSACWGGIQIVWWRGWLPGFYIYYLFLFFSSLVLLWDAGLWSFDGGAIFCCFFFFFSAKPLCMMVGIKIFLSLYYWQTRNWLSDCSGSSRGRAILRTYFFCREFVHFKPMWKLQSKNTDCSKKINKKIKRH